MSKKNVMASVSTVLSFIKERLESDIKEAAVKEMIDIDKKEIEKICSLAKSSIDASFFKSASQIENSLK
tara:strand:+ start:249 stop:455 length:207 start_codon:yes stop_codon:yes gene_type:complete